MLLHFRVANQSRDSVLPLAFLVLPSFLLFGVVVEAQGVGSLHANKYSTRVVRTKYGPLRGVVLQQLHPQVEAFLGVPYATPPVGSLRYMPPVTPSMWRNTRHADSFSPVCPQRPPDIGNRTEALLELPRGRLLYLEKLLPLLVNQSEDCLYLNIYVPVGGEVQSPLPVILYVHGESYEWNSGNPYDGSVLASYGHVLVVTINFRLGVLGFLKTGARGSAQGNFGLMDLVAGLHWLRENIPAFGGDPERITLLGHGTGAALSNIIAVSPVAKELLHRVVMLSGSGLSPWALQREPLAVKRKVAEQTGCHGDLVEDDLAPCLRAKPLSDLLSIRVDPPRFLPGFAPFVDGTVLTSESAGRGFADTSLLLGVGLQQQGTAGVGFEMADFPDRDLLFGLTTTESYLDLSAQDLEFGFNESRRDRILRTYVRNAYIYHLNEIFSTLKNEYTDWERPVQNPLNVRDATLEVLSDGHTVAPLIKVGYLHTLRGGRTYFLHFHHQSGERDFPQRLGSVRGEDVPYVLGLPLVGGQPFFPHNYTRQDGSVSRLLVHYLSNFARKGDPNSAVPDRQQNTDKDSEAESKAAPFWDTYDPINQLYLELGLRPEMRNHYRGHKMSLWLNLIPQLHRPGGDDLNMRHHHFQEEGAQFYEGSVRPQTLQRPNLAPQHTSSTVMTPTTAAPSTSTKTDPASSTTTECPPNVTSNTVNSGTLRPGSNHNNLLRKLASSHYQSYTTALTVTIAVGCFLLLLNILIFAGIYHQRDRGGSGGHFGDKKKEELAEVGSCSSSSGDGHHFESKHALVDHVVLSTSQQHLHPSASAAAIELPLQEFKTSPTSGTKTRPNCTNTEQQPPSYDPSENTEPPAEKQNTQAPPLPPHLTSPSIPDPPPPPKTLPPSQCNQIGASGGILRQQGCPQTPGSMKKRVQIQEISV